MMDKRWLVIRRLSACAMVLLIVAGCAKKSPPPPAPPPPPPPVATSDTSERSFEEAVIVATDGLMSQVQWPPDAKRGVTIDPMVDAASGQQTGATRLLEQLMTDRIRSNHQQFDVVPFQVATLNQAQYLVTGTMARLASERPAAPQVFQISLTLTDLKTGMVVAQAASRARDEGLDTNPTPYYRDSPILVKDKVVDGYITTSQTPPGRPADPAYFERVSTATIVSEATLAYNKESYEEALTLYRNAASTPAGEQIKVANGIYLSTWKLRRANDAEEAFGKVVAMGLSNNNLGVKFLFNPGTTVFWSDPQISGPYGFWLRQIARQAVAAKVCMDVVGHTSLTGSQAYNDRLSMQRATYIKHRLDRESPELASRTKASGRGFRENIVGTGTDDARDALDRRVEFKLTSCP